MRKIKFNLLQILTMISLHVRHQEKAPINWYFTCQFTCSTLAQQITNAKMKFDKVMNTIKRYKAIFQKHTKYNLTVWKIQNLTLIIKITWKRKQMTWLGCQSNTRKIKNSIIFRTHTNSNLGTCTVQNIIMSLNTLYELDMKSKE